MVVGGQLSLGAVFKPLSDVQFYQLCASGTSLASRAPGFLIKRRADDDDDDV